MSKRKMRIKVTPAPEPPRTVTSEQVIKGVPPGTTLDHYLHDIGPGQARTQLLPCPDRAVKSVTFEGKSGQDLNAILKFNPQRTVGEFIVDIESPGIPAIASLIGHSGRLLARYVLQRDNFQDIKVSYRSNHVYVANSAQPASTQTIPTVHARLNLTQLMNDSQQATHGGLLGMDPTYGHFGSKAMQQPTYPRQQRK